MTDPSTPPAGEPDERIVAHTTRVVTTGEAAKEWDAMTQPPTRPMVRISDDSTPPAPGPEQHSPGYARIVRWREEAGEADLRYGFVTPDDQANQFRFAGWTPFRSEADALRFAAAWNAAVGVPTADLTPDRLAAAESALAGATAERDAFKFVRDDERKVLASTAAQRDKLQAFKTWVHDFLDTHGVPHHPPGTHGEHGCRIGDRMDWLMAALSAERASAGRLREENAGLKADAESYLEDIDKLQLCLSRIDPTGLLRLGAAEDRS